MMYVVVFIVYSAVTDLVIIFLSYIQEQNFSLFMFFNDLYRLV